MKLALANEVRRIVTAEAFAHFENIGEDVGMIASNKFNFPSVFEDEECFVEVAVSVVKKPSDECYQEREDYKMKLKEQAEKKAEREKKVAEKKAKAEEKKA